MSIFKKGQPLGAGRRFKIRILTEDGRELYWHKQGQLHTVEEDVADIFLAKFNPNLFEVLPDGSLTSPRAGETSRVQGLTKEPA